MSKQNLPKLHKVASRDNLRPAMQGIFIDGDFGISTNGHVLICANMSKEIDGLHYVNQKIIPWEAWKLMQESDICWLDKYRIAMKSGRIKSYMYYAEIEIEGKYPNYKSITPDNIDEQSLEKINTIAFNSSYIEDIRIAMNLPVNPTIQLYFYGEMKNILILSPFFSGYVILIPSHTKNFINEESVNNTLKSTVK